MSAPPKEIIVAAMRGDVETLRDWFATGNRDANAVFVFYDWADDEDTEDGEPYSGSLLHCLLLRNAINRPNAADAVRLLLAHGADPNLRTREGLPPIQWCEFPEEMSVMLDAGADIHALRDSNGILFRHHGLALAKLALRRGVLWDFGNFLWTSILKGEFSSMLSRKADPPETIKDFMRELTAAGSWKAYARQPRVELVRLRSLCARGRATPPPELERLFGVFDCPSSATTETPKAARAARPLPKEVFWHVLSFWRSSRD
jgi:hypothetical protein